MLGDDFSPEYFPTPFPISLCPTRAVISSLGGSLVMFSAVGVYLSIQATRLTVYLHVLFPLPRLPPDIDREMQSTQLISGDLEVRTRSRPVSAILRATISRIQMIP